MQGSRSREIYAYLQHFHLKCYHKTPLKMGVAWLVKSQLKINITAGEGGLFCSGSPHVACSNEPHVVRFFIFIWRVHKHMSRIFLGTLSPCYLFCHCRLPISEYETWSKSCSNWQFFVVKFSDHVRNVDTKKFRRNCSRRQLWASWPWWETRCPLLLHLFLNFLAGNGIEDVPIREYFGFIHALHFLPTVFQN